MFHGKQVGKFGEKKSSNILKVVLIIMTHRCCCCCCYYYYYYSCSYKEVRLLSLIVHNKGNVTDTSLPNSKSFHHLLKKFLYCGWLVLFFLLQFYDSLHAKKRNGLIYLLLLLLLIVSYIVIALSRNRRLCSAPTVFIHGLKNLCTTNRWKNTIASRFLL